MKLINNILRIDGRNFLLSTILLFNLLLFRRLDEVYNATTWLNSFTSISIFIVGVLLISGTKIVALKFMSYKKSEVVRLYILRFVIGFAVYIGLILFFDRTYFTNILFITSMILNVKLLHSSIMQIRKTYTKSVDINFPSAYTVIVFQLLIVIFLRYLVEGHTYTIELILGYCVLSFIVATFFDSFIKRNKVIRNEV